MTIVDELTERIEQLEKAADDVLEAIDYAKTLRKPRWVKEWLLGSDDRHPEHAAIARLRARVRAIQPSSMGFCPRCLQPLNNLSPGFSIIASGAKICANCLQPGEEIARAKGLS